MISDVIEKFDELTKIVCENNICYVSLGKNSKGIDICGCCVPDALQIIKQRISEQYAANNPSKV